MHKILVIDDDLFIRDLTTQKLREAEYEVHTAASPEAAHQILHSNPIDLILLDLSFPSESGTDYLRELKSSPDVSHIPVIVFSNEDSEDIQKQCLQAGAAGFFVKINTNYSALIETIEKYL